MLIRRALASSSSSRALTTSQGANMAGRAGEGRQVPAARLLGSYERSTMDKRCAAFSSQAWQSYLPTQCQPRN